MSILFLILFLWLFEFLSYACCQRETKKKWLSFAMETFPYLASLSLFLTKTTHVSNLSVIEIVQNKNIAYLFVFILFQKTISLFKEEERTLESLIRDLSYGFLILVTASFFDEVNFFILCLMFLINSWSMDKDQEFDIVKKGRMSILFFFLFTIVHIFIKPSPNSTYLFFFNMVILSASLGFFPFYKLSFYKTPKCFESFIPFQLAALYIVLPELSELTSFNVSLFWGISLFEVWLITQGLIIIYQSLFYEDLRTRAFLFLQTQLLNFIIAVRLFHHIDMKELFSILLIIYAFYYALVLSLRMKSLYFSLIVIGFAMGVIETPLSQIKFNLIKELFFVNEYLLAILSIFFGFISVLIIERHLREEKKIYVEENA